MASMVSGFADIACSSCWLLHRLPVWLSLTSIFVLNFRFIRYSLTNHLHFCLTSFADKGKEYDHLGELSTWWTDEDSAEYNRRTDLLVEQYNAYVVHGQHVNGKLCLGENVADLGGVRLAYDALQVFMKMHGRDAVPTVGDFNAEQVFFLGWSTIWRNNIRKGKTTCESSSYLILIVALLLSPSLTLLVCFLADLLSTEMSLNRLLTDPHSPGEFRANGPLSVMPEFHDSFNVKPGSAMYVEEGKRCEIW